MRHIAGFLRTVFASNYQYLLQPVLRENLNVPLSEHVPVLIIVKIAPSPQTTPVITMQVVANESKVPMFNDDVSVVMLLIKPFGVWSTEPPAITLTVAPTPFQSVIVCK